MFYRKLGRSGLKVSEISLGSWMTYGGYVEREQAVKSIQQAYELGVNFFDTANVYERGAAERLLGETLREYRRDSYVLATKAFWAMDEGPNDRGLSRKHIMEQCDASLKRLGVDYIDIFYCHHQDPETPMQETLRAIDDLIRQGKVLYAGVSNWRASQLAEAAAIADRYLLDRMIVNQPCYNMFERYIEEDIIPTGAKHGIGQVVYSPLAQGLLAGKYNSASSFPANSRATISEWARGSITEEKLAKVRELSKVAAELDLTASQLAIAWILRQPHVASAIIGASRPEQVVENVKASGIKLAEDVLARIEHILA